MDARTTNDVKVSEDGEICVISREGASNRRNGIVIVDCTDPRNIEIISTYDDELTRGRPQPLHLRRPRLRGEQRAPL